MRMRWFLDYLAAFETLILNRNVGDFKAIFKARHAFRKWKHDFDKDREEIARTRVVDEVPERRPYSILWKYYAQGKRTFTDMEK